MDMHPGEVFFAGSDVGWVVVSTSTIIVAVLLQCFG